MNLDYLFLIGYKEVEIARDTFMKIILDENFDRVEYNERVKEMFRNLERLISNFYSDYAMFKGKKDRYIENLLQEEIV